VRCLLISVLLSHYMPAITNFSMVIDDIFYMRQTVEMYMLCDTYSSLYSKYKLCLHLDALYLSADVGKTLDTRRRAGHRYLTSERFGG